jgi:hypothetical protein
MPAVESDCPEPSDRVSVTEIDSSIDGVAPITPIETFVCEGEARGSARMDEADAFGRSLMEASGPESEEDTEEDAGA